jgi:hypothetical protein
MSLGLQWEERYEHNIPTKAVADAHERTRHLIMEMIDYKEEISSCMIYLRV